MTVRLVPVRNSFPPYLSTDKRFSALPEVFDELSVPEETSAQNGRLHCTKLGRGNAVH